jgi:hypothetical protein
MGIRELLRGGLVFSLALWSGWSAADTWPLPETMAYYSANARFRLTVEPAGFSGDVTAPSGTLEQRAVGGEWRVVWSRELVNLHAPASVMVADTGKYVVTFDNWGQLGHGDDVVVVYDAQHEVTASLGLDDFLPASLVRVLPRSSSSIWWGGDHHFSDDGDALMLEVAVPEAKGIPRAARHFRIRLDLASGKTTTVRDMDWTRALAASARLNAEQARQREIFEGPLVAPATNSRRGWRDYSREIHFRLDPEWPPSRHEAFLLWMPPDADFMGQVRSIRAMLSASRLPPWRSSASRRHGSQEAPTSLVFASPAPEVLANALVKEAATVRFGALEGWRVYVTCEPQDAGRLRMAFGRLGAVFVPIHPDQPIPQRPERIRQRQP